MFTGTQYGHHHHQEHHLLEHIGLCETPCRVFNWRAGSYPVLIHPTYILDCIPSTNDDDDDDF